MNDDFATFLFVMAMIIGSFVFGCCVGDRYASAQYQTVAKECGVAHWTIDPQTGERRFEFVRCGEKP